MGMNKPGLLQAREESPARRAPRKGAGHVKPVWGPGRYMYLSLFCASQAATCPATLKQLC